MIFHKDELINHLVLEEADPLRERCRRDLGMNQELHPILYLVLPHGIPRPYQLPPWR